MSETLDVDSSCFSLHTLDHVSAVSFFKTVQNNGWHDGAIVDRIWNVACVYTACNIIMFFFWGGVKTEWCSLPHITAVWHNMAAATKGLPAVASAHWIQSLFSHESSLNSAQVHLWQSEIHSSPFPLLITPPRQSFLLTSWPSSSWVVILCNQTSVSKSRRWIMIPLKTLDSSFFFGLWEMFALSSGTAGWFTVGKNKNKRRPEFCLSDTKIHCGVVNGEVLKFYCCLLQGQDELACCFLHAVWTNMTNACLNGRRPKTSLAVLL